ncbi:GNAT family N-acetyltransferase [Methylocystis heyeri]|uniref:N-acetyltransferase n=1 Tax=Methylocystis heyeri TaxID=391905 RepID=A0A6B8KA95_9HYPH|nr:GNAT family N-acetyltransferase [Methylocystis heyeri]QGM44657.1 N-acetyltransferase [Methylocystis heyeri]
MSESGAGAKQDAPKHGGVRKNAALGRFELEVDGRTAIADFRVEDGVMDFTHTHSPPELRGKGVASRLVRGALEIAREENYKVLASCSFVADFLARHPEFSDLAR